MSKVVFFSDFHAHIFEDFAKPDEEFVNDRFRAQIDTLHKIYEIARENEAPVIFGGDMFHKRSKLEDIVFNNVYGVIAKKTDVQTILLRGNHDSKNNTTTSAHWLETFKYLPHVQVIDKPDSVYLELSDGSDLTVYGIPYSDDTAFLKESINSFAKDVQYEKTPEAIVPSDHFLLVGHIGVDGSEVGRHSHRLEGAFTVTDLYPHLFDYVALGHYHKRQFLGGKDNVFYAGNTIQTSFSDEGQEKGCFLIDFEKKGEPEFIPIENKQFITLTSIDENTQDLVDNHYVRFILPPEEAKAVEVFKGENDNVRVELQKEYKVESRIEISVDSTEEDIVSAYAEEFYPETKDIALDILQEAKSK